MPLCTNAHSSSSHHSGKCRCGWHQMAHATAISSGKISLCSVWILPVVVYKQGYLSISKIRASKLQTCIKHNSCLHSFVTRKSRSNHDNTVLNTLHAGILMVVLWRPVQNWLIQKNLTFGVSLIFLVWHQKQITTCA